MRVFSIGSDDSFREYEIKRFEAEHEEVVLEKWLEANPDGILDGGGVMIIGRQVQTDLGGFIDLLGLDRSGNAVVVELKRDRTPRETIAQSLEYATYASRLDADALESFLRVHEGDDSLNLADQHREYFELDDAEAVAFNKDQRIVVIGQSVTPQIRQTAAFLGSKGVHVTCVEFTFFEAEGGRRLLSQDIVVGEERPKAGQVSGASRKTTEAEFLASCDEHGRAVFSPILEWASQEPLSTNWGVRGFSAGVYFDASRVNICYAYPAYSGWKQQLYLAISDRFGLSTTATPEKVVASLREQAERTQLFVRAGRGDLKCYVDRAFTGVEIDSILRWLESTRQAIMKYGPKP
ncbi:MAG: endonuclease NucS [Gemmatimonadetes bacterium]|nr:endonuclease NucS [Candidatus Palauibacter rhopaloidicola]